MDHRPASTADRSIDDHRMLVGTLLVIGAWNLIGNLGLPGVWYITANLAVAICVVTASHRATAIAEPEHPNIGALGDTPLRLRLSLIHI